MSTKLMSSPMSSPMSQPTLGPPPKVGETFFTAFLWSGVAITLIFFAGRIFVRLQSFRRVFWDDALVLMAWLMLLANALIWQKIKPGLFTLINVEGFRQSPPVDFEHQVEQYLRGSVAVIILFYTCLWSVKISFLIFFRRLGQNVRGQKILWRCVLAVVIASWFTVLGTIQYGCLVPSFDKIIQHCAKPSAIDFQQQTLRWNCVIDVFTDLLVILVPLNMLWKVQISLRQKLALAAIFSLTVFIMTIAIVRVAVISAQNRQADGTWLYTWSAAEQTIAIIVACLASFRALFTRQDHPRPRPRPPVYNSGNTPLRSDKTKTKKPQAPSTFTSTPTTKPESDLESTSQEDLVSPLEEVHSRYERGGF